ncbi:MAG: aminotransferase class V-fold PLP-dependent enzyme [Raineya sp.]|jgi:selenocysteine lyase/cysteine desulfurase|nr:aminotransferase class V-fold PLP-dependent enzyme [Raineya sp.]
MNSQKHLFQLPDDIHYLNCAYMSPLLKSVEDAGIEGLIRKRNPATIRPIDFFEQAKDLKENIAKLIGSKATNIALVPSVSYGMASAINNLPLNNGNKAIALENEFPSGFYTLQNWCKKNNKDLHIIPSPKSKEKRGQNWNQAILEAIDTDTSVIMLSSVHWTDGTKFDLEAIGKKCQENNTFLIVDGTQSVGAAPINVRTCHIDALVCASYKWLFGPYSMGFTYFSERLFEGIPLEESWVNKANAHNFAKLTDYTDEYTSGAGRYNVGETGNFILLPMFNEAIKQLLKWDVKNIEQYAENLTKPLIEFLKDSPYCIEEDEYRSKHLFGISLPENLILEDFLKRLETKKIYVSARGSSIRVSTSVFNTEQDIDTFIHTLKS